MKKILFIFLILFVFAGCSANNKASIKDYFPFKENTYYEYAGEGDEQVSQQMYYTYVSGGKAQRRLTAINLEVTEVLEIVNGELRNNYNDVYGYNYEDRTNQKGSDVRVILKEPLELSKEWTVIGNSKSTITAMDTDITVPYGTFKAMEVTTILDTGYTQKDYYVKDIGLVKTMYSKEGTPELSSSLSNITENSKMECTIPVYYSSTLDDSVTQKDAQVYINTNADIKKTIQELLKSEPGDSLITPLENNVEIKNINVDRENMLVTVDFSSSIYDRKLGSPKESIWMQCLANTIGGMYKVDKVSVLVNGKPFSGEEVVLSVGDYIEVSPELGKEE